MPRISLRTLPVGILLAALGGCMETYPLLPSTSTSTVPAPAATSNFPAPSPTSTPTPTPSPSPTPSWGMIQGYVSTAGSPSVRLVGALVTVGGQSVLTSDGTATGSNPAGEVVTLAPGCFWLQSVKIGTQQLVTGYDDASATTPVTITAGTLTSLSEDLLLPTQGPVPTGSVALKATYKLFGSNPTMFEVTRATGSTDLIFPSSLVQILLEAPPNSRGDEVSSYTFAYVGANDGLLAPWSLPIPIETLTVLAGTPTHSSAPATGQLSVSNSSDLLASNWNFSNNFATLQIALFGGDGHRIAGRDGAPLTVKIPCQLVH